MSTDPCTRRVAAYRLHGLVVALDGADDAVAEVAHATLAYKGARLLPPHIAAGADLTLRYEVADHRTHVPRDAVEIVRYETGLRVFRGPDGRYYLSDQDVSADVEPEAQRATVRVRRDHRDQRRPLFYATVLALIVLLQHRGLLMLHAAALTRGDGGVLLVGRSGSGKTSSALGLVRRGWGFLSDDALLMRCADEDVEVLAFRRGFCLAPDAARSFPEIGARPWPPSLSDPDKWSVDVAAVYDVGARDRCRPRMVLFPEVVGGEATRLVPLAAREAFARLAPQTTITLARTPATQRRYSETLGRLLTQAPAHRLLLAPDVLAAPERLEALVESTLTGP